MELKFVETKDLAADKLQKLFLSVNWSSGNYPEKLVIAMQNSSTVFTAWDKDELIGLVNVLDDGIMTAYIHYLLIEPIYQNCGVGKRLIELVKEKYKDYLRIVLISYEKEVGIYEYMGFKVREDKIPMFITSLWT